MPVMKLDENIKTITEEIDKLNTSVNKMRAEANNRETEIHRLEGSLKMLMAIKQGGLSEIELPDKKEEVKEG